MNRFWDKVEKTDSCWFWTASVDEGGYGLFHLDGKLQKAHRVSWEMANGAIPGGMQVCHHCDVPGCVRPDHLFVGTQVVNLEDAVAKGRRPHQAGAGNYHATLNSADVEHIRELYAEGITQTAIAADFGVSSAHISNIVNYKRWTTAA